MLTSALDIVVKICTGLDSSEHFMQQTRLMAVCMVQGLIHISELAWSRVSNPESVVQPGSLVKCKVISVDGEKGKIGLSLKVHTHHNIIVLNGWHVFLSFACGDCMWRVASPGQKRLSCIPAAVLKEPVNVDISGSWHL